MNLATGQSWVFVAAAKVLIGVDARAPDIGMRNPAIDRDCIADHIVSGVTGEEDGRRGHVFGHPDPLVGNIPRNCVPMVARGAVHVRCERAGRNRRHVDLVLDEARCDAACQVDQRRLRCPASS